MATILYGVNGEGMGHATRSKVVIEHLLSKGHDVHVVASNRACDLLSSCFPKSSKIPGLVMCYKDNTFSKWSSMVENLKYKSGENVPRAIKALKKIIKTEKPDMIFTDFEPTVSYLVSLVDWKAFKGKKKIPLISIDNQHISSNCKLEVPKKYKSDYLFVKYGCNLMVPPKNVYRFLITTFFYPPVIKEKTVLIPSLVRDEIIKAKPEDGSHILVYQTSRSYTAMFDILKRFKDERFIVYGFNISKKDENLTFKEFNEHGFVKDLASCRAAITNGGFTMMSESVFLHKPLLSIPVKKHFEQACNAIYLEKEGFGEFHEDLSEQVLSGFMSNIDYYQKKLKRYTQKDNSEALKVIDGIVSDVVG